MKRQDVEKMKMYDNVLSLSATEAATVSGIAGLEPLYGEFRVLVDGLRRTIKSIDQSTRAITADKDEKKKKAVEASVAIGKMILVLAKRKKDLLLMDGVSVKVSDFMGGTELSALGKMEKNYAVAVANLDGLAFLGVTAAQLTDWQKTIAAFEMCSGRSMRVRNIVKSDREIMDAAFAEVHDFFKFQLTNVVDTAKASSPEFWLKFTNASRLRTANGKAKIEVNNAPQSNEEAVMHRSVALPPEVTDATTEAQEQPNTVEPEINDGQAPSNGHKAGEMTGAADA